MYLTCIKTKVKDDSYLLKVWTIDVNLPGASCVDIHNINPASRGRSGYCVLKTDHLFFAYCNMEVDRAKKAG